MPSHRLDPILNPRAVAVVGASHDPKKRGFQAVRALQLSRFRGAVHPVNPRGGTLLDLPVVETIQALPPGVDLALICTPAHTAADVVRACGDAGIAGAVLLAVGFGEAGPEGLAREEAVAAAARATGVRLVGPNTSGLLNLDIGLNLIGARDVRAGSLGLLVQSGNLALNLMLDATRRSSEGISVCVGVGNEIDLGFADFLDFLTEHDSTRAILLHAEGFRRGPEMLAAAAHASRRKPVVVLKGGRSEAAAQAARSHTGAIAGHDAVLRAALRQAGVIQVDRSDELFHVGATLAHQPPAPTATGVAILTDGGGQGTLAIDRLEADQVRRARLSATTREALRALLGAAAAVENPIDLAGAADGNPERFADALELILDDPGVGCVLVVGLFGGYALRFDQHLLEAEISAARRMAHAAADRGRGLVVHTMYASEKTAPLGTLQDLHVPVVDSLEVACRCVGALIERGEALAAEPWRPVSAATREVGAIAALPEPEARKLFQEAGMPLVDARFAPDVEAAVVAAAALEGPVALKVVAEGVEHKTDAGGVRLDVEGEWAVREAWAEITGAVHQWQAERGGGAAPVYGLLVSPMLPRPVAELLIGTHRDAQVGPVVTVGAGGTWVEILQDVAVRACPLTPSEASAMLHELRISPALHGARGGRPADVAAIVRCIEAMSRLLIDRPDVVEAEINPLFALADGALAVDARAYIRGSLADLADHTR
jgi:acetyltransferase